MHTNFKAQKGIWFSSLKNQVAQKNSCNSTSKQPKSSYEGPNKSYRFWDSYEMVNSDIKTRSFFKINQKN